MGNDDFWLFWRRLHGLPPQAHQRVPLGLILVRRNWQAKSRLSSMAERRSKRWTPQEDDRFRRMAEANTRPEVIAAKLNRSVHAIKARAYMIGLPLKWFKLKAKRKILNPDTKSPDP